MTTKISEKIREALGKFNQATADRLSALLASASEKVVEDEARETILRVMSFMTFFPGIVLLTANLVIDMRVPLSQKLNIALVIAYLLVPDDVAVAALIGPLAYLDDTVLIIYALFLVAQLIGSLDEQVIRDNWVGDPTHADELVKAAASLGSFLGARIAGVAEAI